MNKHKRILLLTELFLPTKGGTAVWFDQVYPKMGGKNIHILTAQVPGDKAHDRHHANTIHRLNLKRYHWLRPESLLMYLNFFIQSFWICLRHRPQTIHAGRVLPEGMIAWLISRLFFRKCLIYAHGEEITTWRQSGKFKAMKFIYRHSDIIIANSAFTYSELLKLGVNENRIHRIHPGVDINTFKPNLHCEDLRTQLQLEANEPLLLSVGRLSRRKGFDTVIQALSQLEDQPLHYALIGTGEDESYLKDLRTKLSLEHKVSFLGHVEPEDLPRWYNACDLFVMPNREINGDTEGFGMVYIEAAACGKTSISGNVGGPPDAVLHNITGLNIDGNHPEQLADALKQMLSDPLKDKRSFEAAALHRAQTQFSWDSVARSTLNLLPG